MAEASRPARLWYQSFVHPTEQRPYIERLQTLLDAAAATRDRMVVVEDHYPAGGIGSAVLEALNDAGHPVQVSHLAVRGLPGSGTPAELMRAAGISADRVVEAARKVLAA